MPNAVTGSSATIVARPVADMDASGQAGLITLEQVSVSVEYDDLYEWTLTPEDSTKLVNAFTVGGKGATFSAVLEDAADFQDVLARNMASALCTDVSSNGGANSYTEVGVDLSSNLYNELLTEFKHVFADTLPNILQSDWALSNTVNYAGGAASMAGLIDAAEAEILAQQIPESNYELYSAMDVSEEMTTAALPLKGTDSIIFVFNVKVGSVIRNAKKTAGTTGSTSETASAGAPGSTGTGAYGTAINSVTYGIHNRAVAFKFTVKNEEESAGKLDGVKAVAA